MPTRFKTDSKSNQGLPPLPSGYEKTSGASDLTIPACGIEDVDVAVFNLFEKEIAPSVGKSNDLKKVPVIFASGEKWAILKRGRPLRDRNNSLILPLITIMRTELTQSPAEDIVARGINQQMGEFVIRRKLDKSDRDYQNLINRFLLPNQRNLAVRPKDPQISDQVSTTRKVGQLSTSKSGKDTAYLSQDITNNVYETLVVPMPQFYTLKYQVTIWTQYTQHSNQILEKIFSSFLPQAQSWKLDTPKGYWFVAKIDDGSLSSESSFEDMSQTERFVKNIFNVTVPAYIFASDAPGVPVPVKRYVSSPVISFETSSGDFGEGSEEPLSSYVIGSDDPSLPMSSDGKPLHDPDGKATSTLPRGYSIKVLSRNGKGETVYSGAQLGGLDIVMTDEIP